jgi:hypothetical protein
MTNEPAPPEGNRGLKGFDRIFKAVKGSDVPSPVADFEPVVPKLNESYKEHLRFSPTRVIQLFIALVIISFVINLLIAAYLSL